MSRPTPDPSNVPSFLIKQVARELSRLTETQLRPLGLGMASLPVLEAVGRPVAVHPDPRLRREALRRGWPIERWGA